jgi:hypothetical protein
MPVTAWNFYEKLLTMVHRWFKLRIRGIKGWLKIAVCGVMADGSSPVRPAITPCHTIFLTTIHALY